MKRHKINKPVSQRRAGSMFQTAHGWKRRGFKGRKGRHHSA